MYRIDLTFFLLNMSVYIFEDTGLLFFFVFFYIFNFILFLNFT